MPPPGASAQGKDTSEEAGRGPGVRPHIRRAHWHHYWIGPRAAPAEERELVVRWLPPILVNVEEESEDGLSVVVRGVN
jgi:hypothetical protein